MIKFEAVQPGQIFRLPGNDDGRRYRRLNFQQARRVVLRGGQWVDHEDGCSPLLQNLEVELVAA